MAKGIGLAKRFGARYGSTVKRRLEKIEMQYKKKHKCPYCNAVRVKRVALGIWKCTKCAAKFTGRAYTLRQKQKKKVDQSG